MPSVGVLVGGTTFAQIITLLALPAVTRLYDPSDFSILAVYTSLLGIISVVACLRLDIAIPMPERNEDAANLLALAIVSSLFITTLSTLAVWLSPQQISRLVGQPKLQSYLWLLPVGIFLASTFSALQYWAIRGKYFRLIARIRINQSLAGSGTQIALGWLSYTPLGLILGQILSCSAGIIGLSRRVIMQDIADLRAITRRDMYRLFRAYDRFPKYSTFEALSNSAAVHFPVIMIAALAIGPEAGFVMLAIRVMHAPMALIGSAVSQVYLSQAPDEYRAGRLGKFTAKIIDGLMRVGVGPIIFVGIIGPDTFALVFGKEWTRAGVLVAWMTPWFVMQFLSSPISMVMHVINRQRFMLGLTLFGLSLRAGSIGLAVFLLPSHISEIFSLSGAIFYFLCFYIFTNFAGVVNPAQLLINKKNIIIVSSWTLFGLTFQYLLSRIIV